VWGFVKFCFSIDVLHAETEHARTGGLGSIKETFGGQFSYVLVNDGTRQVSHALSNADRKPLDS